MTSSNMHRSLVKASSLSQLITLSVTLFVIRRSNGTIRALLSLHTQTGITTTFPLQTTLKLDSEQVNVTKSTDS
jgi:hypothetical protein